MTGELQAGDTLGPYQVLRVIARGGQGAVFEGRDPARGLRVAIKVLSDTDPVQLGRFLQEAQVLARLQHPNLPRVFEVVAEGPRPWFAMELIQGRDLADWVAQGGLPAPEAIVEVLSPVARALHYCHGQGIVHRDLKPRNILIEERTSRVVLADFGLVQRDASQMDLEAVDALGRLSLTHEVKGTPSYMAPEQADAESFGGTGPQTDVYALGATLFYLLTGSPPQEGQTTVNVMVQLLKRTEAPDAREKNPDADPALSELARACLQTTPAERPATAEAVAQALESCPVGGQPRSAPGGRVLGALLFAVLVLAVLGGASWALLGSPGEAEEAVLWLSVDADRVEVFDDQERLGWASPEEPLRIERAAGATTLRLRREGAELELSLDLAPGETRQNCELWREVELDPGRAAQGSVRPSSGEAAVRDQGGRDLSEVALPARLRLPLGRYRVTLRADEHHPREAELVVAAGVSLEDLALVPELRWRKKLRGTIWTARPELDLDGDGIRDILLHSKFGDVERVEVLSGREGAELWPERVPVRLWTGSALQEEPRPAVVAVRGTSPSELLWLDPKSGQELRTLLSEGRRGGRKLTLYGLTSLDRGRRGILLTTHYYDEAPPARELIHLGPDGTERARIDLAAFGAPAGKELRASYPAPFDAELASAEVALWRVHRTYYLVGLGSTPRVLRRYPPPPASAAIANYRGWYAVGDGILPVSPERRAAVLTWIGQDPSAGVQSHLALIGADGEPRWRLRLKGFYAWGRWLELQRGRVFAAAVLTKSKRTHGRVVLIDPERGEVLRETEVNEGLVSAPQVLRSRGGVESLMIGTCDPALVRLLDPLTFEVRWTRDVGNRGTLARKKGGRSFEVGRYVSDLDGDGADELIVVRSWDGEVVVYDPIVGR